jgi:glycosidase
MLDAQFDFNLYDQAVQAFGKDETTFENLSKTLQESLYNYGSHHGMGNISGNQDRCRFISYADGSVKFEEDSKVAGWTREITNHGKIGYQRLAMLHAFNFAVPGIPVIYYGDEIGLPGANDPDNRRMMVFEGLDSNQTWLKNRVTKLAKLRRNNMALMYGQTEVLLASTNLLILKRSYLGETVVVVFNKSNQPISVSIDLPNYENSPKLKAIFGSEVLQNKGIDITVQPMSFEYLVGEQ